MKGEFINSRPIYQQIIDQVKMSIAKGELEPGERVLSVRDLALQFKVNPNTMQKSLAKLEDLGYLYSERTSGRYVTGDLALIERLKAEIPSKITDKFVTDMVECGLEPTNIPDFVRTHIERSMPNGQHIRN